MTQPADARKRWDTDERYGGVADASAFAAEIAELASLARRPRWVAEDPDVHLIPHLRDATKPGQTGLRLLQASVSQDGVLTVAFEHAPGASRRDIRRQAWALLGAIAETMASVRERRVGGRVILSHASSILTLCASCPCSRQPPRSSTRSAWATNLSA